MLNGAFAVRTPDVVSHPAEEVPWHVFELDKWSCPQSANLNYRPSINLPKTILAQFVCGFVTAIVYLIAIFYGISELAGVLNSTYPFPLTEIYRQATGLVGGSFGLLVLAFIPSAISVLGCYLTANSVFWTLARENATPFNELFSRISQKHRIPSNSIILCAVICTLLGCIYLGSSTAFSAFVGSFIVLSMLSYLMAVYRI